MNRPCPPTSLLFRAPRVATALFALCVVSSLSAQTKKNPTSKLYVADMQGQADIETDEKILELTKKSVHSAQGTVIETKKSTGTDDKNKAYSAMVYSNGTGIYFDPDTRLEVKKFVQEPFTPNRSDMETEPSISQTQTFLSRGVVGLCTSRLVAGSSMVYSTPQGSVNIRGKKVVVEAGDQFTRIAMLEGESTVRGGSGSSAEAGGQTLHEGEQAIIRQGSPGHPPQVQISRIPQSQMSALDDKVSMACMAKKTVYFEVAERKVTGDGAAATGPVTAFDGKATTTEQEIVPVEVVPADLPVQFTVSPARLGSG